jgi:hypothetical protein
MIKDFSVKEGKCSLATAVASDKRTLTETKKTYYLQYFDR